MFNVKEQRKRQIDTLRTFNDNVETLIDGEKYEIKFKVKNPTSGSIKISLIIELDQEFPYNIPKLSLIPSLVHQWIDDENMITKAPGILNFTINSDLGRVCQAIIREFEKNPPEVLTTPQPLVISSSIPEILNLHIGQLQSLLQDEQYLDDFVEELGPIKALNLDLDTLIESNEEIANQNLSMEGKLNELKNSIGELSSEFLELGGKYEECNKKYVEKSQEYSPDHIKRLLQISVSNAEADCEQCVDSFLNGDQSVNQFLDGFMETKKLIATRKFKEERLNFQLNQLKL